MLSFFAFFTKLPIEAAPSRIEYCECTCKCTNVFSPLNSCESVFVDSSKGVFSVCKGSKLDSRFIEASSIVFGCVLINACEKAGSLK
ncbi:MAG: hypothetical protein BWY22_02545 [Bacteroidetes bacterium ADurb.Bin217]|nr:MAG: hypothetical protein BWY22_02545 [Bacteroidetes bacterium ADurb.Bin217]